VIRRDSFDEGRLQWSVSPVLPFQQQRPASTHPPPAKHHPSPPPKKHAALTKPALARSLAQLLPARERVRVGPHPVIARVGQRRLALVLVLVPRAALVGGALARAAVEAKDGGVAAVALGADDGPSVGLGGWVGGMAIGLGRCCLGWRVAVERVENCLGGSKSSAAAALPTVMSS